MLDTLPDSAILTRHRVETRMLDIPLAEGDLDLHVNPRQTRAVPVGLSVIERTGELFQDGEPLPGRGRQAEVHRPFVRLSVERRTKLEQKSHTGDAWFDISEIRPWLALSNEDRQRRFTIPRTFVTFAPETVADLQRLSDRALELYAKVAWDRFAMSPVEAQR